MGTVEVKARSGRPRKLAESTAGILARKVKAKPDMTRGAMGRFC